MKTSPRSPNIGGRSPLQTMSKRPIASTTKQPIKDPEAVTKEENSNQQDESKEEMAKAKEKKQDIKQLIVKQRIQAIERVGEMLRSILTNASLL